ncbi:MAG: glycosyltransferase, partial [Caulobacter sp.]|nr:glycosyltransferase [Vitreoscilla sp.]
FLFFANRGLEDIYDPHRVLTLFAGIAAERPDARLVVANGGSLAEPLKQQAQALGLADRIEFVGRLDAAAQAAFYARATWYLSVPRSDSVSVSVLEAMGHGCIPLLSDLPANRELVREGEFGENGLVVPDGQDALTLRDIEPLRRDAPALARYNHGWVGQNALFGPSVDAFVARLEQSTPQ